MADSEVDEEPGRGPGMRGFESLRSPQGRAVHWRDKRQVKPRLRLWEFESLPARSYPRGAADTWGCWGAEGDPGWRDKADHRSDGSRLAVAGMMTAPAMRCAAARVSLVEIAVSAAVSGSRLMPSPGGRGRSAFLDTARSYSGRCRSTARPRHLKKVGDRPVERARAIR